MNIDVIFMARQKRVRATEKPAEKSAGFFFSPLVTPAP